MGDPFNDRDRLLARWRAEPSTRRRRSPTGSPLADAAEAYRVFDAREATKVVLLP